MEFFTVGTEIKLSLPFAQRISAGFPSPAEEYLEVVLDLNDELIKNATATFYGRVKGNSMVEANIKDGDILVIDKSLEAVNGDIAVFYLNGEFTVKRLKVEKGNVWLMPYNKDFAPNKVSPDSEFRIWGIVTNIVHKTRR